MATPKKKSMQDATLINVRALKKRASITELHLRAMRAEVEFYRTQIEAMARRVAALETRK